MYIGNPDDGGLETCVFELLTDSILDFMAGFGDRINVTLNGDGSVTVEDFGRGLAIEIDQRFGRPIAELRIGTLMYDFTEFKRSKLPPLALHGVGRACVNALAARMEVKIRRGSEVYSMGFVRGEMVKPLTRVDAAQGQKGSGVTLNFKPDPQVFGTATFNFSSLARRLEQTSFLNKGLFVEFRDQRSKIERLWQTMSFYHPNGLSDVVRRQATLYPEDRSKPIAFSFGEGEILVEAAIQFDATDDRRVLSFVNQWQSREGGTHVEGFLLGLRDVLKGYGTRSGWERKCFRVGNLRRGIIAVLAVSHPGPHYYGSRKDKICNEELLDICRKGTVKGISEAFEDDPQVQAWALAHMMRRYR
jgi:DNA gyrase subunit B